MTTVLLAVHVLLAIALIVVVLLQRSEGGALGMGGGGMGSFMTARGTANLLTRTTAIVAALFMLNSIVLAMLASRANPSSVFDRPAPNAPLVPPAANPAATPEMPGDSTQPRQPSAPVAE